MRKFKVSESKIEKLNELEKLVREKLEEDPDLVFESLVECIEEIVEDLKSRPIHESIYFKLLFDLPEKLKRNQERSCR